MGKYEMSVFLYSLFAYDSRLIIGKNRAKLITHILQKKPQQNLDNKLEEKKRVIIMMLHVKPEISKYLDTIKMIHLK